ncbi:hypothetical protein [Psychrobacter piscatorii]|uniref:hypothetical protein n=1 Tax=Psychrobacter piscatorii TaxID=554343 RepID=UPI0019182B6C|nr:hypothetical protein [Psychrobacter piscatorii]
MQNSLSKRLSVLKPSSLILSLAIVLTACSSTLNTTTPTTVPTQSSTNNSQMLENTLTQCPTSHSESTMCTMQYDPVCVKTKVGSVISYRTAGNACSACNIPEAIGYTKGECS